MLRAVPQKHRDTKKADDSGGEDGGLKAAATKAGKKGEMAASFGKLRISSGLALQVQRKGLDGRGGKFADVDFDAGAQSFARGLQESPGHFGADVGFATVVADLRGHFPDHESRAVALERNGGMTSRVSPSLQTAHFMASSFQSRGPIGQGPARTR